MTRHADDVATAHLVTPKRYFVPLLGLYTALVVFTTDVYLPVLPQLGADLGVSDSAAAATISTVLIGIAIGQLVIGPLSDALGRKGPLLIGVLAYAVLHVASALAPNINVLLAERVGAGIAAAACMAITRAMIADAFPGASAAVGYSTLAAVIAVAPVIAPLVGGALANVMDWRGMFIVLAVIAFIFAVIGWFALPETLPKQRRIAVNAKVIAGELWAVTRHRRFLAFALAGAAMSGVLFSYIGSSAFVLENRFGLTPQQFGYVFASNAVGIFAMSWLTRLIVLRVGPAKVLRIGQLLTLTGALVLALGLATSQLPVLLIGLFMAIASIGMVGPTSTSLGMRAVIGGAGAAAGVMGITQFATGALLSPIASLGTTGWAMVLVILACAVIGLLGRVFLQHGTHEPSST